MKLLQIVCLTLLLLSACSKTKQTDNKKQQTSVLTSNKQFSKIAENKKYFTSVEDFKRFILGKKWVDIKNRIPCDPHGQHITIEDGFIDEYNTIEPSKYKVDVISLIDSKTLGIKIISKSNRDVVFKVKVIDKDKQLVKWIYNYNEYEAKPYDIVCEDWDKVAEEKKSYYLDLYKVDNAVLEVPNEWKGLYYYESEEAGEEFILDTRNNIFQLEGYHFIDQLKAIQVGDTLGLYHHKNISGSNYDDTRSYDFLKFYKSLDGKYYFEGKLPYLPEGAIEFEKVK
ncbi:hypothetical protein [Aquimarina agarivorans]|uniref:hypothetical protein n=1 Tax=Aquimarina agarivorans TaxID=980584 RepID=UPI000248EAA9|nr:hypothetical protein [Aquimarina agarivorans]